ncbi:hypothetical protein BT93_L5006 [Corymbia citriodora subsp. variegata]|uniref:Ankyrin repeat protein n=1 Tax=Corymbia citriodora subsp. variegata TaxID=360336 RepID=A0A8T0CFB1_CORYI|nr:hypothetical protein BT93_L5006 [Corymbia citriodora subsp. variegata]
MAQNVTIDRLLNLVPENPSQVLTHLGTHPHLASAQDSHGYSLLHAAVSYNHASLLRALVQQYSAEINLRDEDGETPLFASEVVSIAQVAVEELHADASARNDEGQTCAEKMIEEDDFPEIVAYLLQHTGTDGANGSILAQTGGTEGSSAALSGTQAQSNGVHPPPPLPNGVKIDMGTMRQDEVGEAPDPEFRRRIEELAARGDFEGEEGQRELRRLIEDAVQGIRQEEETVPIQRRRLQ